MGFFRKIFGKEDSTDATIAPTTLQARSPASIGYDPKLVATLQTQHAALGTLFARIGQHAQKGEFQQVHGLLAKFKATLDSHILVENVRFYTYLENSLGNDPENARTMREFRQEMNSIAKQVRAFVAKWKDTDCSTVEQQSNFLADYKQVGSLLEQRLNNEEDSLYPLYQPT